MGCGSSSIKPGYRACECAGAYKQWVYLSSLVLAWCPDDPLFDVISFVVRACSRLLPTIIGYGSAL